MNNKSRIALAITAAFGTAALGVSSGAIAQTSSVQIGGSLNAFYSISKPNNRGGTLNSGRDTHDNLSLTEPEIWIHGEEKIGNSMTAWFRCTSSFDVFGTAPSAGTGQWCGRNSALGFKTNFGNIYAGNWDSAAKMSVYNPVRLGWFGGTASLSGGWANVLLNGSDSNVGNVGATFVTRRARQFNYDSPNFSGFVVRASISAQNEATAQTTVALQTLKPRDKSLGATYNNGPLYVGIGWTEHQDFNPALTPVVGNGLATGYNGGKDINWMLGASYKFGSATTLSGMWATSKYDVTNSTELKKKGFVIFAEHRFGGPHVIRGAYFQGGDSKGNSAIEVGAHQAPTAAGNTGAKGYNLAYTYEFSKRTEMGFIYGLIDNEDGAKYSKGISRATLGATQKVYGLNVRHKF